MNNQLLIQAAAAWLAPVFLNRAATLEKVFDILDDARWEIQRLACPKAFLPNYPDWVWTAPTGEGMLTIHQREDPLMESLEHGEEAR